ncbi:MAG TPA: histidine kinase dimerization/phosphoacceptor domain -containing protein [Magnetospirillaceae bacterium]|nr:histidine kinase dimerization/phosphoacceptor domain -containing protein [Magnetospirillaceae bacterium]
MPSAAGPLRGAHKRFLPRIVLTVCAFAVFLESAGAQNRLFNYVDGHTAIMLLIDPETGRIREANRAAAAFYGYPAEVLERMYIHQINILSTEEVMGEMRFAAAQIRDYFVFPHRLASGEIRTVEVYSSPVTAPSDGKVYLLSIIHDVTGRSMPDAEMEAYRARLNALVDRRARELVRARSAQIVLISLVVLAASLGILTLLYMRDQRRAAAAVRSALAERNRLFDELQHRVKNSFAAVASIISIEASRSPADPVQAVLETLRGRVETLAALYRILHEGSTDGTVDLPAYLREIALTGSEAYDDAGSALQFDSSVGFLAWDARRASNLGLILNELLTNAYKHSPERGGRAVRVRLDRRNGALDLAVSNPGPPLPEGFQPGAGSGFGLLLVTELVGQFRGELRCGGGDGRVEFSVRVPV